MRTPRHDLDEVRAAAGEGLVTWYVKLSLQRRRDGQTVLLASLHQPDRDFDDRRVGGPLKIQFQRRRTK